MTRKVTSIVIDEQDLKRLKKHLDTRFSTWIREKVRKELRRLDRLDKIQSSATPIDKLNN